LLSFIYASPFAEFRPSLRPPMISYHLPAKGFRPPFRFDGPNRSETVDTSLARY